MFKYMLTYYSKEEIPTYDHLIGVIEKGIKSRLSRRYVIYKTLLKNYILN